MVTPKEKIECVFDRHIFEWFTKGKTKTFRCTKCDSLHPEYPVLKTRTYKKWGYELRDIAHDNAEHGGTGITMMTQAYTLDDGYCIGNKKTAYFICVKKGIKPEKKRDDVGICTIGFNEAEQKWYGWSHRAICGFKIGDVVKKGDCTATTGWTDEYLKEHPEENTALPIGFIAKTLADCKKMAIAFAESIS